MSIWDGRYSAGWWWQGIPVRSGKLGSTSPSDNVDPLSDMSLLPGDKSPTFIPCETDRAKQGKPRSVSGIPDCASVDSITERTVSLASNSEICETQLSFVPLRMATSPLSACTPPCRISIRVDFPEPFGPIRPMRSPSDIVNEIFRKSGATPYRLDKPCALIIGGKLWGLLLKLV